MGTNTGVGASSLFPPPPRMPKRGPTLAWARSFLFWLTGRLGDLQAILSSRPERVIKRVGNKLIGRNITRNIWLKRSHKKRAKG
jgi:hypothetical protein